MTNRRTEFAKVDAHHHIWDLSLPRYPWLQEGEPRQRVYGDSAPLRQDYLPSDYKADCAGFRIEKSVYVQCGWDPNDPVGETRYIQEISDADPEGFPHAIVAHADLDAADAGDILARHCEFSLMRGVRMLLSHHDVPIYQWAPRGDYMTDAGWLKGYERLAAHGLSFDAQLYPHQMPELAAVAERFPEVPLVIDHCGMPIERETGGLQRWRDGMEALASLDHVHLKISGLGMVDHDWTRQSIEPIVREAIRIFGPARCIFASNFPVDKLKSGFATLYDAFLEITRTDPIEDQRAMFHDNAVRFYRL